MYSQISNYFDKKTEMSKYQKIPKNLELEILREKLKLPLIIEIPLILSLIFFIIIIDFPPIISSVISVIIYYVIRIQLSKIFYPIVRNIIIENGTIFIPKELNNKKEDLKLNLNQIRNCTLYYFLFSDKGEKNSYGRKLKRREFFTSIEFNTENNKTIKISAAFDVNKLSKFLESHGIEPIKMSNGFIGRMFQIVIIFSIILVISIITGVSKTIIRFFN